jgi:hypothetical protein
MCWGCGWVRGGGILRDGDGGGGGGGVGREVGVEWHVGAGVWVVKEQAVWNLVVTGV